MKYLTLLLLVFACAVGAAQTKPEAKPTDGVEPIYTTVPVTQKVPSCKPGYKLMYFDPAYTNAINAVIAPEVTLTEPSPHPARWVDTPTPNVDMDFSDYKCFPDPKATAKDSYPFQITVCEDSPCFPDSLNSWRTVVKCEQDARPFHYKNCELENGATLTDVVNALMEEK